MKNPTLQRLKTLPFNLDKIKNQRKFEPMSPDETDNDDNDNDDNTLILKS